MLDDPEWRWPALDHAAAARLVGEQLPAESGRLAVP